MPISISPKFTETKLSSGTIEDMIDVFEDQVAGWLLQPAHSLSGNQHAGFAVLSLSLAYFEPLCQFLDGQSGGSRDQFTRGLKAVFPTASQYPPQVFQELYDQLRCGMFHQGITKQKVAITGGGTVPIAVTLDASGGVGTITVDPWRLLASIDQHQREYVARLRTPSELQLRAQFVKWFRSRGA